MFTVQKTMLRDRRAVPSKRESPRERGGGGYLQDQGYPWRTGSTPKPSRKGETSFLEKLYKPSKEEKGVRRDPVSRQGQPHLRTKHPAIRGETTTKDSEEPHERGDFTKGASGGSEIAHHKGRLEALRRSSQNEH